MAEGMPSPERPTFVPKTPEQLQRDSRNLNLQKVKDYKAPFEVPQAAVENPQSFIREIKELRQNPDALKDSPYARYEEYVKALRQLRKSQRWHQGYYGEGGVAVQIEQVRQSQDLTRQQKQEKIDNLQSNIGGSLVTVREGSLRENYLETVGFAPHLAREVLVEKFNRVPAWSDEKPVFTDQEISRGLQNEQGFLEVLNTGLDRQPGAVYKAPRYLLQILPPERVKGLIEKAGVQGNGFVSNFKDIKSLFTPEEQRAHIDAQLRGDYNPYQVLSLFQNPDAVRLYQPEEVHNIVVNSFKRGHAGIQPDEAEYYLNNGVISKDDLKEIVLHQVRNLGDIMRLPDVLPLLPDPNNLTDIKAAILDTYTARATGENAGRLYWVKDMFTPEEMSQMVKSIALRDRSANTLRETEHFEDLITPEEYAPVLREVLATPGLELDGVAVEHVLKAKGLTEDEKERFVDQLISTNRASLILDREGDGFWGFSDEVVRNRVAKKVLLSCDTRLAAEHFRTAWGGGWEHKVGAQTTLEIMDGARLSETASWIYQLKNMGHRLESVDPDYLNRFLEKHKDANAAALLSVLPTVVGHLPDERRPGYIQDLIRANPVAALIMSSRTIIQEEGENVFEKAGIPPVTPEQIMQLVQADTDRLSFAPKALREFVRQYQSQIPLEEQKALLIETMSIYRAVGFIKALGLEGNFKQVQAQRELPLSSEKELVSTYYCLALLKDRHPEAFANLSGLGNSLEESKVVLFNQLSQLVGVDRQLNQEEIARFFGVMETPVPFMMYMLQYEKSPAHRELLKNIFESIVAGKFSEWKFGPATQEGLDGLKQANLIPEGLSLEQYLAWRNDGQTTLFESLATDTETTANAISTYIQGNVHHLHIEETMESLLDKYPDQDLFVSVQSEMGVIGQGLATTNRELSDLRKSGSVDANRITELEGEKIRLENARKELLRARKILRLASLKPNEVASGFLLEGKDGKQRGDSIDKVLGELREVSAEEDRFVYDEVQNMFTSLRTTSNEKQNLLCTDSSDPKVWIEIGEKPVASCQSYDNGGYNECLVAYTDPNTKILVLRNEKGNIIGRSIFRLLTSSNGNPALHIERVYSSSTSKGVLRSMFARAYQKATEMGLPLLISEQSQDEGGGEKQFEIADGYQATKVDYSLISKASRAPKVYVDSAGGLTYGGNYEMKDLLEVQKAA